MIIKGKVTKIMPNFCWFQIDNKITVYLGPYYLKLKDNSLIQFPALNSTVEIEYNSTNYNNEILYPEKLQCSTVLTNIASILKFLKYLRDYNISQLNAIKLFTNCHRIYFKDQLFSREFLASIKWGKIFEYRDLLLALTTYCKHFKEKSLFEATEFSVFTPNSLKLTKDERARNINVLKFNNGNNYFDDNLIGYLEVSNEIGYVVLRDAKHDFICQIVPGNSTEYSRKLTSLLNNIVIIKSYVIFTENTINLDSLEYIYVCIDSIEVLINRNVPQNNEKLQDKGRIQVISRSSVCFDSKTDTFECLSHCLMNSKECFIRLDGATFTQYPLFNTGDTYSLSNYKRYGNIKLDNKEYPLYIFPEDAKFTLLPCQPLPDTYSPLTLPQVKQIIEQNIETHKCDPNLTEIEKMFRPKKPENKVVSFTGVIKTRSVMSDSKSKSNKSRNFGVRGKDVHQIYLQPVEDTNLATTQIVYQSNDDLNAAEQKYFENHALQEAEKGVYIYLHNFKTLQTPLCLVPDMEVTAWYMFNPKEKYYLKPSNLTRIEPLRYNPPKKFNTTPELIGNENWGPPELLGQSSHIPPSSLVWGTALVLHFTTLSFFITCNTCKNRLLPNESRCCQMGPLDGQQLQLTLGLKSVDPSGPFDALAKEDYNLKKIFGLGDIEWKLFRKMFIESKYFTTSLRDFEQVKTFIEFTRNMQQHKFKEYLNVFFEAYNYMGLHNFQLKCRKMRQNDIDSFQKFYLVEARANSDSKHLYYAF